MDSRIGNVSSWHTLPRFRGMEDGAAKKVVSFGLEEELSVLHARQTRPSFALPASVSALAVNVTTGEEDDDSLGCPQSIGVVIT